MDEIDIARVAHQANKALCEAFGDYSQVDWDDAPEDMRKSVVAGVCFLALNPDALPSASHDAWLSGKLADGWQYGPIKDAEKKTHPCMVSFYDLPPKDQAKDYIFIAICRSLLEMVDE